MTSKPEIEQSLIVDPTGKPFEVAKPAPVKRYNLKFEIHKAIHSGAFFGLQEHGTKWLSGLLVND